MLSKAVFHGLVPVLGPSRPVTAEVANAMHQVKMVEISVLVPSIIQDLASSKSSMENLCRMNAVIYGGGTLPSLSGNAIAARTRLYNSMGSSEMNYLPTAIVDREDWNYFKFSPKLGYQMRHHSGDLFELVFIRKPHLEHFQAVFSTFPNDQEYSTRDLYIKHLVKPNLWKYSGRADDIMALTTGEKINPIDMETLIGADPEVQSVLVVGQARFQTALLVEAREPPSSSKSKKKFVDNLWHVVQKANAQCDTHARISRDLILLTTPEKPFLRAGKGTVQRRLTEVAYTDEINELYRHFEDFTSPHSSENAPRPPHQGCEDSVGKALSAMEMLQTSLQNLFFNITGWTHLNIDTDFFTLGMDSLQVLNVVRAMNREPNVANPPQLLFTAKIIYTNPTIRMLAKVCAATQHSSWKSQDCEADMKTNASELERLISKYTWNMPITCRPPISISSEPIHVLLTGSSGSLGSYLVDKLLRCPKVAHIYCLNRSPDSEKRQRETNKIRGLSSVWSTERITFFQSDLSQEYLGLQLKEYRALLGKVTHVLHNAWEVNFNLPLTSLETPHVVGVRQYIDFSVRSAKGASIFFVSSVSSCMKLLKHDRKVPEYVINDPSVPLPMGYAQSKYVAEQVLARAAEVAEVPVRICRVGQVAGPVHTNSNGACWNKKEWLPSLIASSKHIGKIPKSLGPNESIDWIPVDILSQVLVDLMEAPDTRVTTKERNLSSADNTCLRISSDDDKSTSPYRLTASDMSSTSDHNSATKSAVTVVKNSFATAKVESQVILDGDDGDESNVTSNVASEKSSNSYYGNDGNQHHTPEPQGNVARVYHAVNPHRTTWSRLLPAIQEHFGNTLQPVSLQEWVATLGESAISTEDVSTNPAIRLLDFFQGLLSETQHGQPIFETVETERKSRELAAMEAVKPEWMKLWLEQWNF